MRRLARRWVVVSVGGCFVLVLWGATAGRGQAPPPPAAGVPAGLNPLVRQMADQVRHLGEEIASEVGQTPRGRHLQQDTAELAQAVNEFHDSLQNRADRFQVRQSYAGIDVTWHHLMGELSRPGSSTPVVDRAAQRVAQTEAQIHRSLGLNEGPAGYYGVTQAPTGMTEVQRLAHALVDRADALAAVVRAEVVGPGGAGVVQDAVNLAQAADTFHDAIDLNGRPDAIASNGFAGVAGISDRLGAAFAQTPPPPRVLSAWRSYRSVEVLLRQALGLANPPAALTGTLLVADGPAPLNALADQLVEQINAFLQVFSPTAGNVPEGAQFLIDATSLQAAAVDFRQDVLRQLNPAQLAFEFRDVDATWQRLARRTNRISRGRNGPNIQQVGRMGETVAEIHRLLGIPGYPPTVVIVPAPVVAPAP